jgi:SAM-dependent methyltransferase
MQDDKQGQALAIRLWMGCLATQEMLCTYLGIRLGLYDALAAGPATPPEFAARAGIAPRYAREWLEQQAVAGIVQAAAGADDADSRVFTLPASHYTVLSDSDSPMSKVAAILPVGAVALALPLLLDAYRTGGGVADADYGPDWRRAHGSANRSLFLHQLVPWLGKALPDVHARLTRYPSVVVDVGCGAGWAAITLASHYPAVRVVGYDVDPALLDEARWRAKTAGLADRVDFVLHDCSLTMPQVGVDLICLFDTLHEIPQPVELLRCCREACTENGAVFVMDARVADAFRAPADEIERFQYTTSVLHCLPACLAVQPSAGTGTAMRADLVRRYAAAAGFSAVSVLPLEDRFHRFYRLS